MFRVKVSGVPVPELAWYHNGEEVMAKELAEDGSLTIPSAEIKHSGVYRLVAVNRAGRMEREVKLFVRKDQQPKHIPKKEHQFKPIPVEIFGDYISECHANDNMDFNDQYNVSISPLLSIAIQFIMSCIHIDFGQRRWY